MSSDVDGFLITKPKRKAPVDTPVLLLSHGAGAPMDSPFLEACATRLAKAGVTVVRFEFAYMDRRRRFGVRLPPQKMEDLAEGVSGCCCEGPGTLAKVARVHRRQVDGRPCRQHDCA